MLFKRECVFQLTHLLNETKVASFYKHPKIWIIRIQKMRWKQRIVCGLDERTNSAGMKTLQIIVPIPVVSLTLIIFGANHASFLIVVISAR